MSAAGHYKGTIHAHLKGRPGGGSDEPTRTAIKVVLPIDQQAPNAAEMAVNFTQAMGRWISAGVPVVTDAQFAERSAICGPCEYWDEKGNFGLGKCKAPGCGCTKLKRWLATEVCKHPAGSKWPALQPSI